MSMRVCALGINYRDAALPVREALAFNATQAGAILRRVADAGAEGVLIATCNRTELYAAFPAAATAPDLRLVLAHEANLSPAALADISIAWEEEDALTHLFSVCTGLDSMVLGEPQVLGQARSAYQDATAKGFVGPALHIAFQQALSTAKQARTATGIDRGRTSIGSVAADVARQIFRKLSDKTVLAIGAGEIGKVALTHLAELQPGCVVIANRSVPRAVELSQTLAPLIGFSAATCSLDEVEAQLVKADVAVFSTAAPHPMLTVAKAKAVAKARRGRPLLILDLAVPRDVEQEVGKLSDIYLYNIDDLQGVIATTEADRREKTAACETFIARGVATAMAQIRNRSAGELMRRLRDQFEAVIAAEEDRLVKKVAALPQESGKPDEAQLRLLLADHHHHLVNKFLRGPAMRLNPKHHSLDNGGLPTTTLEMALGELFGVEYKGEDKAEQKAP